MAADDDRQVLLVMSNLPDQQTAQRVARTLIDQRLAACVSVLAPCTSLYHWHGAVENATEVPLLIKNSAARYAELESVLRSLHPYELPEIIAVPLDGSAAYLAWIEQSVSPGGG